MRTTLAPLLGHRLILCKYRCSANPRMATSNAKGTAQGSFPNTAKAIGDHQDFRTILGAQQCRARVVSRVPLPTHSTCADLRTVRRSRLLGVHLEEDRAGPRPKELTWGGKKIL